MSAQTRAAGEAITGTSATKFAKTAPTIFKVLKIGGKPDAHERRELSGMWLAHVLGAVAFVDGKAKVFERPSGSAEAGRHYGWLCVRRVIWRRGERRSKSRVDRSRLSGSWPRRRLPAAGFVSSGSVPFTPITP